MPVPAIGLSTPIATPGGFAPAGSLRPGNLVLTRDHGPLPILAMRRHDPAQHGPIATVHLRAPYFGLVRDCIVSGTQAIALSGVDVEYLFGLDEVLAEARHLADGTRARLVPPGGRLGWVSLDLGNGALVLSGACGLATAPCADGAALATLPARIDRHAARALVAMQANNLSRNAA